MLKLRRAVIVLFSALLVFAMLTVAATGAPQATQTEAKTNADVEHLKELLVNLPQFLEMFHVSAPSQETLLRSALDGLFRGLNDPYSHFMTVNELNSFVGEVSGEFSGVGVRISLIDGTPTVTAPIPGTPAAAAGIKAGDKIIAVNGINVIGKGLNEISSMIRGDAGTTVTLTIQRHDEQLNVQLQRVVIKIDNVETSELDGQTGYIRIIEFSEGVGEQFAEAVRMFQDKGLNNIILDLRDNPGGLVSEAVDIVSELLAGTSLPAMQVQDREGTRVVARNQKTIGDQPFNLVVLINESSASASEIVAGAVQDAGVGKLIGMRTYGKGTVQQLFILPTGEGIKVTVARYLTAGGRSIDGIGLTPDILVENPRFENHVVAATRVLKRGMIGLDVLAVEEALQTLGYRPGEVDGIFDWDTGSAVGRLQASAGLVSTGCVDTETLAAINRQLKEWDSRAASVDVQLSRALEYLRTGR